MTVKNKPWTPDEDQLVLTSPLSLRQLGTLLNRTPGAVSVRRVTLKKRGFIVAPGQPADSVPAPAPPPPTRPTAATKLIPPLGIQFKAKPPSGKPTDTGAADPKAAEKAAAATAERAHMDLLAECRELRTELLELADEHHDWSPELVKQALAALRRHDLITYHQITDQLFVA